VTTTIFKLTVLPIFKLNFDKLVVKYGQEYKTNNIVINPLGGLYESNYSNVTVSENGLLVNKNILFDTYDLILKYSYNDQYAISNLKLIIEPDFYYSINKIELNYFDKVSSVKPYVNPHNGIFSLETEYDNIKINKDTGIIYFENICYGNYIVTANYNYNGYIVSTTYNIISKATVNYNNSLIPNYHPLYGTFTINPNKDYTIDSKTGEIIVNKQEVGNYTLNVYYQIDKTKISTIFNHIIKPTITYRMNKIIINFNSYYVSEYPNVEPLGGEFSLATQLNGVVINKQTGQFRIYQENQTYKTNNMLITNRKILSRGQYELKITYKFNNVENIADIILKIV
jgi:hypothetical protein